MKLDWSLPRFHKLAFTVWYRNLLVWRKLMGAMVMLHFGEPIIWLVGLGAGLGMFIQEVHSMSYLTFLATGYMASSTMMSSTFEGMYAVYTRMVTQGTYSSMMTTPMKIDDIMAGETLWCSTKGVFTTAAILLVGVALGAISSWWALLALPVGFLVGFAFVGLAMCVSALSPGYDFFNYYFTLFVTPLFVMSGVFYPVETLPEIVQGVVGVLPLYHAVELIRPLAAGQEATDPLLHLAVLLGYGVVGHYLAVVLTRKRLVV